MAINTWQDAIGEYARIRGFSGQIVKVHHIHADVISAAIINLRPAYGPPRHPAACICELVVGDEPPSWERVTPWGKFYRFRAVDLEFLAPLELLALTA